MENYQCLNCSEQVTKNFCPNCGQKADTHRITLKHFVMHDLLHGVWHLERGILFTLKEAIARPGQAALDYIGGKRIRYYNVFYLCLLLIALNILLAHLYEGVLGDERETETADGLKILAFFSKYLKVLLFGIVPILAIDAWLFFKRLKRNLAEHFIIAGMNLVGIMILGTIFYFFRFINHSYPSILFFGYLKTFCFLLIVLFPMWAYYNATRKLYTFWEFLWRIVLFNALVIFQFLAAVIIIVFLVTQQSDLEIHI